MVKNIGLCTKSGRCTLHCKYNVLIDLMKVADLAVINFLNLSTYSSTKIFKGKVYKFEVRTLEVECW